MEAPSAGGGTPRWKRRQTCLSADRTAQVGIVVPRGFSREEWWPWTALRDLGWRQRGRLVREQVANHFGVRERVRTIAPLPELLGLPFLCQCQRHKRHRQRYVQRAPSGHRNLDSRREPTPKSPNLKLLSLWQDKTAQKMIQLPARRREVCQTSQRANLSKRLRQTTK